LASGGIIGLRRHLRWGPCGGLLASLDSVSHDDTIVIVYIQHHAQKVVRTCFEYTSVRPATTPHHHPKILSATNSTTTQCKEPFQDKSEEGTLRFTYWRNPPGFLEDPLDATAFLTRDIALAPKYIVVVYRAYPISIGRTGN
jgi:hypothetical protein